MNATVPATNKIPWTVGTYVGVPTGIVARTTVYTNILKSYANGAIQTAIDNVPAGQVITLEEGTHANATGNWTADQTRDSFTIRGLGTNALIPLGSVNKILIGVGGGDYQHAYPSPTNFIISAISKGTTNVVVTNVTDFAVGKMVLVSIANDTNVVLTTGPFDYMRREQKVIHAVSGNTVTLWPPFYSGYEAGQTVICSLYRDQTDYVGLENIVFNFEASTTEPTLAVLFQQAYGCWVSNVVIKKWPNHALIFYDSLFCEARNYVANDRTQDGSNGSGLLMESPSGCLMEDSVITGVFPSVEVNHGSSGNVIGYSFFYDATAFGVQGGSFNINHSGFNQFNLYEGNMGPNVQSDGYFAGSGLDTIYRNWWFGIDLGRTNQFVDAYCRGTRGIAVEGNILGLYGINPWAGHSMGNPNIGNSLFTGTATPSVGDWWTNFWAIGVVTNRTSASSSGIQMLDPTRLYGITDNWWPIGMTFIAVPAVPDPPCAQMTLTNLDAANGYFRLENHNSGTGSGPLNTPNIPAAGTQVRIFFGNAGYQEIDLDVSNRIHRAENYLFNGGIPAEEQTGGLTDGPSLYRNARPPTWPSTYNLGAVDPASVPTDMTLTNHVLTPAHYFFLNGSWPTESATPDPTPSAIGIRGINLKAR